MEWQNIFFRLRRLQKRGKRAQEGGLSPSYFRALLQLSVSSSGEKWGAHFAVWPQGRRLGQGAGETLREDWHSLEMVFFFNLSERGDDIRGGEDVPRAVHPPRH